jgi:hypothetical protein
LINKLTTGYWENTFITADRASEEYLLRPEDLGELTTRAVRSAHETTSSSNVVLYLKTDVERRAIEVWGSWPALEAELWRRQTAREEEEKRRQGLSALIAHLKKLHKDQSRMQREAQVKISRLKKKFTQAVCFRCTEERKKGLVFSRAQPK